MCIRDRSPVDILLHPQKIIEKNDIRLFNIGYLYLRNILSSLGLKNISKNISESYHFKFDLYSIIADLVCARIIYPGSKRSSYLDARHFIESPEYKLENVYRSLPVIADNRYFIESQLYKNSRDICKRNDLSLIHIFLIANIGLYEYEILPQEKNAIAVTILRSVGEMGDWGVFPTELSQQLRHMTAEYELTFFSGDLVESGSYRGAYQFQVPVIAGQTGVHAGTLPAEKSWLDWNGEGVMFSNLKAKGQDVYKRQTCWCASPPITRCSDRRLWGKWLFWGERPWILSRADGR